MKIASVLSTKGGPGKTTVTANLGAFCADSNIRTLLIDLDTQPSLSSFYRLDSEAPGGSYQLISQNETISDLVVSRTCIPNADLEVVYAYGPASFDPQGFDYDPLQCRACSTPRARRSMNWPSATASLRNNAT